MLALYDIKNNIHHFRTNFFVDSHPSRNLKHKKSRHKGDFFTFWLRLSDCFATLLLRAHRLSADRDTFVSLSLGVEPTSRWFLSEPEFKTQKKPP